MASEVVDIDSTTSRNSTDANIPQNAKLLPVLRQWRPRHGRDDAYELFQDSLEDALVSLAIDPAAVGYPFPTMAQLRKAQPHIQEPQLSEMLAYATKEYQAQGTAIYHMAKTAYIIDGVHQQEDLEDMRAFAHGLNRDGRGLLKWAMQWSDDSTYEAQMKIGVEIQKIKFTHDSTGNTCALNYDGTYLSTDCALGHGF